MRPRPGSAGKGVRNGTVLFEGSWGRNDSVFGTARLFGRTCGEIEYDVSGAMRGSTLTLRGEAPVRDRNCDVVRYRDDTLIFRLAGGGPTPQPAPQPAPPQAGPGDWYAIAGTFRSQTEAQQRADELDPDTWYVLNTRDCPNLTNGFWVTTAGPFGRGEAQAYADDAAAMGPISRHAIEITGRQSSELKISATGTCRPSATDLIRP